jgi:hypothetical protein
MRVDVQNLPDDPAQLKQIIASFHEENYRYWLPPCIDAFRLDPAAA